MVKPEQSPASISFKVFHLRDNNVLHFQKSEMALTIPLLPSFDMLSSLNCSSQPRSPHHQGGVLFDTSRVWFYKTYNFMIIHLKRVNILTQFSAVLSERCQDIKLVSLSALLFIDKMFFSQDLPHSVSPLSPPSLPAALYSLWPWRHKYIVRGCKIVFT